MSAMQKELCCIISIVQSVLEVSLMVIFNSLRINFLIIFITECIGFNVLRHLQQVHKLSTDEAHKHYNTNIKNNIME